MFRFELQKIFKRRISLIVILLLTVVFPTVITFVAKLSITEDQIPEGLFLPTLAYFVITLTQSYFFLPLIVLFLCGKEFDTTHISLTSFYRGRNYYLKSKLAFAVLITIYTTAIGLASFYIAFKLSAYDAAVELSSTFLLSLTIQLVIATFAFCSYLFLFLFLFRSTTIAVVAYIILSAVEGILFKILSALFSKQIAFAIPSFIIRSSFVEGGIPSAGNYYTLNNPISLVPALLFALAVVILIPIYFRRINLKTI
jgi:hypothetical protein